MDPPALPPRQLPPAPPQPLEQSLPAEVLEHFWQSFEHSVVHYQQKHQQLSQCNSETQTGPRIPQRQQRTNALLEKRGVRFDAQFPVADESAKDKRTRCKKQPLVGQFSEFLSKKLASKGSKKTSENSSVRESRRSRKKKSKKSKKRGAVLFGPDQEEPQVEEKAPDCFKEEVLGHLRSEIADLKTHGSDITNQMWLLYSTFEEFLRTRHPETAAAIKRYHVRDTQPRGPSTSHYFDYSKSESYTDEDRTLECLDVTNVWLDEVSHLQTSVAETTDWLSPEEEFEDWSDDTDRVHKLSESDSETENERIPQEPDTAPVNAVWLNKIKKIDKRSPRNYRSRTPEGRLSKKHPVLQEIAESSFEIETPVRRPEDLFGESCQWSDSNQTVLERPTRRDYHQGKPYYRHISSEEVHAHAELRKGQGSPVTISSGYESDKEGGREAEIDSILYDVLPGYHSPPYVAMMDPVSPDYQNIHGLKRPGHSATFVVNSADMHASDVMFADDTNLTVIEEGSMPPLNRSKSLDSILRENGVIFIKDTKMPSPGKQEKVSAEKEEESDDEDGSGASSVYENLPAALYAQVSPPKPHKVYNNTPKHLNVNPVWESTPMEKSHKPRIINTNDSRDTSSDQDASLRSQIRRKIGFLLDDKSLSLTPYKSAFRPYTASRITPMTGELQVKLQEHSIAELRRNNGQFQNGHYLCMTQGKNTCPRSPVSILVDDVSLRNCSMEQLNAYNKDANYPQDKTLSPDSGRGSTANSDKGSVVDDDEATTFSTFPGYRNPKLLQHQHVRQHAMLPGEELDETMINNGPAADDHIYETIPIDITTIRRDSKAEETDISLRDTTCQSEHTYCRIGEIPSVAEYSKSFQVPEPPPARTMSVQEERTAAERPENKAKSRSNIYGVLNSFLDRREFSNAMKLERRKEEGQNKRSFRGSLSKIIGKYRKGSQTIKPSPVDSEKVGHVKQNSCDFTPGFSRLPPFETSGPQYTHQSSELMGVKKTLSFQDLSPRSAAYDIKKVHYRQESLPVGCGMFKPVQQRPHSVTGNQSFTIQGRGSSSNNTPTVIDGVQSYQSTPTDVTRPATAPVCDVIISPPMAFKNPSPPKDDVTLTEDDDPVYENIRDMEMMRQNRKRAVEEGTAFQTTPLRRTQSALQIHWALKSNSPAEIFC